MPLLGEQVWRRRARDTLERDGSSFEGALGSRSIRGPLEGGPAPERGGTSPEGATGPRARRNLTREGDRPSREAKLYRYGVVPLERSGVPPEGG
jgi:hypothetical protein